MDTLESRALYLAVATIEYYKAVKLGDKSAVNKAYNELCNAQCNLNDFCESVANNG